MQPRLRLLVAAAVASLVAFGVAFALGGGEGRQQSGSKRAAVPTPAPMELAADRPRIGSLPALGALPTLKRPRKTRRDSPLISTDTGTREPEPQSQPPADDTTVPDTTDPPAPPNSGPEPTFDPDPQE